MDLSIIIVNWNTRDALEKCLSTIFQFTSNIVYEVVVIDNGSGDGSPRMVKDNFPQAILFLNAKNLGFAKAVNQGINISKGEFILLFNSDSYIQGNVFEKMVLFYKQNPGLGAITCKAMYPDGTNLPAYSLFPSITSEVLEIFHIIKLDFIRRLFPNYDSQTYDYENDTMLPSGLWPGGGCLMVSKKTIERVGLLDEEFSPAYLEDSDWCLRMARNNLKFFFISGIRVYHYRGLSVQNSSEEFKNFLIKRLESNKVYFFNKHYGALKTFYLKLVLVFKYMVFLFGISAFTILKPSGFKLNQKKAALYFSLLSQCFLPRREYLKMGMRK